MKKKSVLAIFVFIIAIVLLALVGTQKSQASKNDGKDIKTVYIHSIGCDNCNNVSYCIDGAHGSSNTCDFTLYLEPGSHYIKVCCNNSKAGELNFKVIPEGQNGQNFNVYVSFGGDGSCICDLTKKK
jgi:hypothetical protein